MLIERIHAGKVTSVGMASGIVAGLVGITPAAGHVVPMNALFIGALSSAVCYAAVQIKNRTNVDDSLDAFAVHGVGGIVGALLTGVFCFTPVVGLLGGDPTQLGKQALGVAVSLVFCGGMTALLGLALKATIGLRVTEQMERDGLDISIHGERGYHLDA